MEVRLEHDAGLEGTYGGNGVELWNSRLDVRSQLDTGGIRVWHQEGSGISRSRWDAATWSLAVSPSEDDHRLGMQWGRTFQLTAELAARDGGISKHLEAGIHQTHWNVALGWTVSGRQERWDFSEPQDTNRLELAWNSQLDRKDARLEFRPVAAVTLLAGMSQEKTDFGTWQDWGVGDSGHASAWSLGAGWDGDWGHVGWNGLWRNSRLVTMAWKNDDGERRIFHELAWSLDRNCQSLEWSGRYGRVSAGAERMAASLERPQDRREFLFWNALDGSTWAPLFAVLYSRSDFLEGSIAGAHEWLELRPRFAWSNLNVATSLGLDHLDAAGELRWRRREIQGFALTSTKDTTHKELELWLLRPAMDLELSAGRHWKFGLGGGLTIPLQVTIRDRQGDTAESGSANSGRSTQSESLTGGWFLSAKAQWRL
jgi:hypothetical protein